MKTILDSNAHCVICDQKATGWHFGAVTCRACAAFFRRAWHWKSVRKCRKADEKCGITTKGLLHCKKCRLQKCLDEGMSVESYKVDQNFMLTVSKVLESQKNIPPTLDTFLGRSNLIIVNAASPDNPGFRVKQFVDLRHLLEKAAWIMKQGVESPVLTKTSLQKLAFGLEQVQKEQAGPDYRVVRKMGKEDTLAHWENDFLKVIKWLTYFDSFHQLPGCLQMTIGKTIWKIWSYLTTLEKSAMFIRRVFNEEQVRKMSRDTVVCDWSYVEIDMSWCSRYSVQEIQYFVDFPTQWKLDDLTRLMVELKPSDVELSYMLCQLCFDYVGKKFQGEILETVERFQASLANDLHQYYVEDLKWPNYLGRLTAMMKINKFIHQKILLNRSKRELGKIFDIIDAETSNPEMFEDM